MLEGDYSETLTKLLNHLPATVQLPEAYDAKPNGATSVSLPSDSRRYARIAMRSEAVCEVFPTLPAISRARGFVKVHTKDISRGGIAFLTPVQLYPCEQLVLWTLSGKLRCEVKRCQKLGERCYEIGAAFPEKENAPATSRRSGAGNRRR